MLLSKNFSLDELTYTMFDQLQAQNHAQVTPAIIEKLKCLCVTILQPVRDHFKLPVYVSSGFRGDDLNDRVGGSETSQHRYGEAGDFSVKGFADLDGSNMVFDWIRKNSGIPYGQLIHEQHGRSIWIHGSLGEPHRARSKSRQAFRFVNGVYLPIRS